MNKSSEKPLYFVAFVWLLFFNLKEVENNVQKWRFSFDTFCRFGYNGTILQVAESQKTQNKVFLTDANHIILGYRVKLLEERILRDGKVFPGEVLKVGGFLNHLIDDTLMEEIGKEIYSLYKCDQVTKILTLEASGIAIACYAAMYLHVPVLFAKKSKTANISKDVYSEEVKSYTHGNVNTIMVEKEFLNSSDRVLIVDDFLAHGEALRGLIALIGQAGATLVGCAIAIEKGFQKGGDELREQGVRIESLAIIESMSDDGVTFRKN